MTHRNAAPPLNPDQVELLQLIATGLTTDSIARRLGISARTVRRREQDICRNLGARSRMEAAAEAARKGWISDTR